MTECHVLANISMFVCVRERERESERMHVSVGVCLSVTLICTTH